MGSGSSKRKSPRLLVVFGATGRQGGSVIRGLRTDPGFVVKAVSRNPESTTATTLADSGIEVVKADLDDVDSLKSAVDGAYGVFVITDFWEHHDKDTEIQQGQNIANVCKQCKVSHVIYSGLEDQTDASMSTPFDAKQQIVIYMKTIGLTMTTVVWSFYYENLLDNGIVKRSEEGEYLLDIPVENNSFAMVSVVDGGECVHQIFKQGKKLFGKTILLAGHHATVHEYATILTENLEGMTFKAGKTTPMQSGDDVISGKEVLQTLSHVMQNTNSSYETMPAKRLYPDLKDFGSWTRSMQKEFKALE